ncbi:hypothetical protein IEQ34_012405 [Dendrobium chrysotoxum]|uniref:Secreted protein n=1 Tax=Dendrobium chrysotoxum TaxID=161865 RepID=A0AAV7GUD6_DENCH|nr:hypothetical protein IEQ34_012405 [Dendrobium chrysotoxum]
MVACIHDLRVVSLAALYVEYLVDRIFPTSTRSRRRRIGCNRRCGIRASGVITEHRNHPHRSSGRGSVSEPATLQRRRIVHRHWQLRRQFRQRSFVL